MQTLEARLGGPLSLERLNHKPKPVQCSNTGLGKGEFPFWRAPFLESPLLTGRNRSTVFGEVLCI